MDSHPGPRPPRRVLLLVNRRGARGGAFSADVPDTLRHAGIAVDLPDVEGIEASRAALRAALADPDPGRRPDAVIVGGGDGTLNALADVLAGSGVPLGVLPLGTANDLARTLDLPPDPVAACGVVADGWTMAVDLGVATWADGTRKHYFNVASLGAGVDVAKAMRRRRDRNARWGVLSYPMAMAETAWDCRPFHATVVVDGHRERVRAYQVSVGNGARFGGGMRIAPDAAIDDGILDVTILKHRPRWRVLLHLPALRRGRHDVWDGVLHLRGRHVEVRPDRPMDVNADGELVGRAPAVFDVARGALRVFVPGARAAATAEQARREATMTEDGWTAMRGDAEVALDDVTVGCKRTADHLADAAEVVADEDAELAALFNRQAGDRRALAADLDRRMLEMDGLPGAPDDDLEMVGQLARRLRHVLSSHDREALIVDRVHEAEDLAHDTSAALAREDIPASARSVLRAVQERTARDLEELKAARRADGDVET